MKAGFRRSALAVAAAPAFAITSTSKPFNDRVVVFGEAAMLTAQERNFGMTYTNTDDRQLVLNVTHWLTGLSK